ncbi:CLUMA_CG009146, isoform A [Clunio marinus]|uniref:CLUMA_CG009146, isoform A n=1 Tax=Clunio marinus TaxID=568069 RepID=A0A1J1I5Y8_9DIPT|nr:CLUMA_CG009146, isoform A [Clunio marinus]
MEGSECDVLKLMLRNINKNEHKSSTNLVIVVRSIKSIIKKEGKFSIRSSLHIVVLDICVYMQCLQHVIVTYIDKLWKSFKY